MASTAPTQPAVFPGDFLSHEEERAADGENVYVEHSDVFALRDGHLSKNDTARTVSVSARKVTRPAKPGDVAFGKVRDLHPTMAAIEVQPIGPAGTTPALGESLVYCRISEIQRGFLDSFREALRAGDIVRVRFTEFKRLAAYVTMKDADLGVVRAFCSECRTEMKLRADHAECLYCGSQEPRKVADFSWANAAEFKAPREFRGRDGFRGGERGAPRDGAGFGGRREERPQREPRRDARPA